MKFEEALAHLRNHKILTRIAWKDKRLEFEQHEFNIVTSKPAERSKARWKPDHDDLAAQDWALVDPDDIKEFTLSVNQLKELGVKQSKIDSLKGAFAAPLPEHVADMIDVNEFIKKKK